MEWAIIWKTFKKFGGPAILAIIGFLREAENREKLTEALTWLRRVIGDATKITSSLGFPKRLTRVRSAQKDKRVVRALIVAMKIASPENRQGVAEALVAAGSPAVGLLCKELKDPEPSFRKSVAWALGEIGDVDALVALVRASGDQDAEARASIEDAISKIIGGYSSADSSRNN